MKMKKEREEAGDDFEFFNGSGSPFRAKSSYEEIDSPASSQPFSSFESPSSSHGGSPSFVSNEEEPERGHLNISGTNKGGNFACRLREHVKMGANFSETVKGKVRLGAKIIQKGGRENIFKEIFGLIEGEEFLKASQCYLSTSNGPIAGLLFISTAKVAFYSERSINLSSSNGEILRVPYKVSVPVKKIKSIHESVNVDRPEQKYIELLTVDGFEFWFMGFLRYEKAFTNLQKAISMASKVSIDS